MCYFGPFWEIHKHFRGRKVRKMWYFVAQDAHAWSGLATSGSMRRPLHLEGKTLRHWRSFQWDHRLSTWLYKRDQTQWGYVSATFSSNQTASNTKKINKTANVIQPNCTVGIQTPTKLHENSNKSPTNLLQIISKTTQKLKNENKTKLNQNVAGIANTVINTAKTKLNWS